MRWCSEPTSSIGNAATTTDSQARRELRTRLPAALRSFDIALLCLQSRALPANASVALSVCSIVRPLVSAFRFSLFAQATAPARPPPQTPPADAPPADAVAEVVAADAAMMVTIAAVESNSSWIFRYQAITSAAREPSQSPSRSPKRACHFSSASSATAYGSSFANSSTDDVAGEASLM